MDFKLGHEMFLEYCDAKDFADGTLKAYAQDARSFLKFLAEKELTTEVESITAKLLRQYNIWLKSKGLAVGTIGRRLDSMSSFLKFMEAEEVILTNPMKKVDRPQPNEIIPIFLTREELNRILKAADNTPGTNWARDRALLRVLAFMGLRRSELFNLNWNDIDFKAGIATIRKPKNKKDRIVPMNQEVQDCLWEYLQSRLPLVNQAVAINRYHNRMEKDTLGRIIRKFSFKARIDKHVTAHVFRHTCGTLLVEAGVDLITVAEILGHKDIQSTTIYTHTTPKRLSDAVSKLIF